MQMEKSNKYVSGKKASELLGVHQRTLHQWDAKGLIEVIRTPGGKRMYNVQKYLDDQGIGGNICDDFDELGKNVNDRLKICYVRVSSAGQKDDLERQKQMMIKNYPEYVMIEDIGSGLNLNKRGIKKIIKLAIDGKIEELVVAYRDRLTRFGYELIEEFVTEYSHGKITVLNENTKLEPEEELVKDVMAIMNVYVAKMNGLRKYAKKHKKT